MTITYIEGFEDIYSPKDLNDIVTKNNVSVDEEYAYGTNIGANNGTAMVSGVGRVTFEHGYFGAFVGDTSTDTSVSFKGRVNAKFIPTPMSLYQTATDKDGGVWIFNNRLYDDEQSVSKCDAVLSYNEEGNLNEVFDYIKLPTHPIFNISDTLGTIEALDRLRLFYNHVSDKITIMHDATDVFEYDKTNDSWTHTDLSVKYKNTIQFRGSGSSVLGVVPETNFQTSNGNIYINNSVDKIAVVISLSTFELVRIYHNSYFEFNNGEVYLSSSDFNGVASLRDNGSIYEIVNDDGLVTTVEDDSLLVDGYHKGLFSFNTTSFTSYDKLDNGLVFIYSKRGWSVDSIPTKTEEPNGIYVIYDSSKPTYQRYQLLDINTRSIIDKANDGVTTDMEISGLTISPDGSSIFFIMRRNVSSSSGGKAVIIKNVNLSDLDSLYEIDNYHSISSIDNRYSDYFSYANNFYFCEFSSDSKSIAFSIGAGSQTTAGNMYLNLWTYGMIDMRTDLEVSVFKTINSCKPSVVGDLDKVFFFHEGTTNIMQKDDIKANTIINHGIPVTSVATHFRDVGGTAVLQDNGFIHVFSGYPSFRYYRYNTDTLEFNDFTNLSLPISQHVYMNYRKLDNETWYLDTINNGKWVEVKIQNNILVSVDNKVNENPSNRYHGTFRTTGNTMNANSEKYVLLSNSINTANQKYPASDSMMNPNLSYSPYIMRITDPNGYHEHNIYTGLRFYNSNIYTYGKSNIKFNNDVIMLVNKNGKTLNMFNVDNMELLESISIDRVPYIYNIDSFKHIAVVGDQFIYEANVGMFGVITVDNKEVKTIEIDNSVNNINASYRSHSWFVKDGLFHVSIMHKSITWAGSDYNHYIHHNTSDFDKWKTLSLNDASLGSNTKRSLSGKFGVSLGTFDAFLTRSSNDVSSANYNKLSTSSKTQKFDKGTVGAIGVAPDVATVNYNTWDNYRIDTHLDVGTSMVNIDFFKNETMIARHAVNVVDHVNVPTIYEMCSNSGVSISKAGTSGVMMHIPDKRGIGASVVDFSNNSFFDYLYTYSKPYTSTIGNTSAEFGRGVVVCASGVTHNANNQPSIRYQMLRYENNGNLPKNLRTKMIDVPRTYNGNRYIGARLSCNDVYAYMVMTSDKGNSIIYRSTDMFLTYGFYHEVPNSVGALSNSAYGRVVCCPDSEYHGGFLLVYVLNTSGNSIVDVYGVKDMIVYRFDKIPTNYTTSITYHNNKIMVFNTRDTFITRSGNYLAIYKVDNSSINFIRNIADISGLSHINSMYMIDTDNIIFKATGVLYTANITSGVVAKHNSVTNSAYAVYKEERQNNIITVTDAKPISYIVEANKNNEYQFETIGSGIGGVTDIFFNLYPHDFINEIDDVVINDFNGELNNKPIGEVSIKSSVFTDIETDLVIPTGIDEHEAFHTLPVSSNEDKYANSNKGGYINMTTPSIIKPSGKYIGSSFNILTKTLTPSSIKGIISSPTEDVTQISYLITGRINEVVSSKPLVLDYEFIKYKDIKININFE